jgi:phospholipid transport system substrate-binding protein
VILSRRKWLGLALMTLALSVASPAWATPGEDFIKARHTELTNLLKQSKDAKIESIFDDTLDYDSLAKESLKDYWEAQTPEDRAEFQRLLKQLVRNAYKKNLKKTLGYEIEYKGSAQGASGEVVRTIARSRTNQREEPISVDYVVKQVEGKWRVQDIVTEGSSLVMNYRSQFRKIIKKHGFAELLKRMKNKADQGGDMG